MLLPEGLRTVKWNKEGNEIVESDFRLQTLIKKRVKGRYYPLKGILEPIDIEEWLEEHYNVMA